MKIAGYTRSDGVKVKGYNRKGTKSKKKYSAAQKRALQKSRTSKTGHKSWQERQKTKKPGLWSNYWAKRNRENKRSK